ncbi:MAG: glutamine amidotransferase-related protein [Gammaproteobacteria bacterium]
MRKLLVLQHVPNEPLGVLDPLLRTARLRIRYVNFARDPHAKVDMGRYAGLVVLGGPMNVDESDRYPHLNHELEVIRAALEREVPTLGICLGAQLLAAALGARVHPNPVREIGWYPLTFSPAASSDPLFRHLTAETPVFQWHAYTFSEPSGTVHLASSASCANQAFRYEDFAYGLQFHLEADRALIRRWLAQSESQHELEAFGGADHVRRVEEQTTAHLEQSRRQASRLFEAFVQRLGWRRSHRRLGSR